MLIQRLCEYANERLELPPAMYQEQAVRYEIALATDGRYLGYVDTADSSRKEAKRGARRLAPHVKRAYAIKPKVLADTGIYALGIVGQESKPERVKQQHEQFAALVDHCAQATSEPTVAAVATFLRSLDVEQLNLPEDFDPSGTVTFRIGDVYPIDLPAVRTYWAGLQGPDEEVGSSRVMTCIGCGNERPVLERHPIKIRGIPGGQILKDLISANAGAFESYGLSASLIAPTCYLCAEAYANGLNALLADRDSSLWAGGAAYAFWTRVPHPWNPARLMSEPEERQVEVKAMMEAYRTGAATSVGLDSTAFYSVGLGASGARVVVTDWIDAMVGEAQLRMGRYFALQEMVDAYGAPWVPLSLNRLLASTVRDPRKEDPPAVVVQALARLALAGTPLPLDVLYLAVRRNRADQDVSRARAMLIKMVLGSRPDRPLGGERWMSDIELASTEPAYLCGRLLAVLDVIQARAIGNPNASIVDKYFGSASSAPASVFGTLMHGAQAHMGKLRRDQRGVFNRLEQALETITTPLAAFPKTLSLEQQGLFALGFYHQRAADRRAAREWREARDGQQGAGESTDPPTDQPTDDA